MMVRAISASTLLSSAMVISAPDAVTSESAAVVETNAQTNRLETPIADFQDESISSGPRVEAVDIGHWSAAKNARFKELARGEALAELSIEELAELETLTRLRRLETYPRSAEEILWQRQQQELTRKLVQALNAYVEFHETSRNP